MSTLISQVPDFVRRELDNRKRIISANEPVGGELLWMQSKTPWIKMQSNAILSDETNNKNRIILYSGWLNVGERAAFEGMYQTGALRPNPGITELHSTIKGHLGIMREVRVKFKAYTLAQLGLLQDLYMTPGIGVLVEWGWSVAYARDKSGKLDEAEIPSLNLDKLWDDDGENRWLRKTIQDKVANSRGLYDALFGLVCNFAISFVDDGTWDCETTIVGPGAMTVDINLKSPSNALDEKFTAYLEDRVNKEMKGEIKELFYTGCTAFKGISADLEIYVSPEQQERRDTENKKNEEQKKKTAAKAQSTFGAPLPYGTSIANAVSMAAITSTIESTVPPNSATTRPIPKFPVSRESTLYEADPVAIKFGNDATEMLSRKGVAFSVTSIHRTEEENQAAGGAENSFHLKGKALDFPKVYWDKLSPEEKQTLLDRYNFEQIGNYPTHIHVEPKGPNTPTPADKATSVSAPRVPPPTFKKVGQTPFEVSKTNVYVTWEFIENALNNFFEEEGKSDLNYAGRQFIDSYVNRDKNAPYTLNPLERVIPCMDFNKNDEPYLWRSFSPINVLIPGHPPSFEPENETISGERITARKFSLSNTGYGDLAAVWINYNVVVKPAFQNSETFQAALNDILNKMNEAAGGVWSLHLMYDNNGYASFRVVDMKCTYTTEENISEYIFNLNTRGSIVRDANISMIIPNELKATVMIAANAPEGKDEIESSIADRDMVGVFRSLTRGVRDRYAVRRNRESKKNETKEEENARAAIEAKRAEKKAEQEELIRLGRDMGWHESMSGPQKSACINKIFRYMENSAEVKKYNAIIPLDLTLILDGIAGLTWGNAFNVTYLPNKYSENAFFQIKDISHDVTVDGWTTTIVGMMRPKYNGTATALPAFSANELTQRNNTESTAGNRTTGPGINLEEMGKDIVNWIEEVAKDAWPRAN